MNFQKLIQSFLGIGYLTVGGRKRVIVGIWSTVVLGVLDMFKNGEKVDGCPEIKALSKERKERD